jgi:hypothetical protein
MIQYFVEFANVKGPSQISAGSSLQPIVPGKTPSVTIPTDQSGAATQRNIWRQLANNPNAPMNRSKVDIVKDNTTTQWLDINRS